MFWYTEHVGNLSFGPVHGYATSFTLDFYLEICLFIAILFP